MRNMDIVQEVKVITCRGRHALIGETIGEALREELRPRAAGWQCDDKAAWRIREYLAAAREWIPELIEEIRGVERGAGLPEHFLMAGQANPPNRPEFTEGCSNIVFREGPDGPLWGKNNDDDAGPPGVPHKAPPRCILRIYPDHGIPLILCTYCGWIGGDMMNAEGVATGGASGGHHFFQSPYDLPSLLWLRAGMHRARSAEDFARHVTSRPLRGRGSVHVTVDGAGSMFSTEILSPLVQLRRPQPWMRGMECTNWYQLPHLTPLSGRGAADQENARGRSAALQAALRQPTLNVGAMKKALRHHGDVDICRHGAARHDRGITEWSMIGIPRQRKVLFCKGNPCSGHYDDIKL